MTDQTIPTFVDDDAPDGSIARPVRGTPKPKIAPAPEAAAQPTERKRGLLAVLDTPVIIAVGLLLAIGLMMVYSTTFDWSYQVYDKDSTVIFMRHVRNMGIGFVFMLLLAFIDYRVWKRFSVPLLLVTFALLVAVLLFGDNTFGARRAFLGGSYQPGELAELTIIVYLAAWLSSKNTRVRSVTQGLIPFGFLVGVIAYLVLRQPDVSTAAMIIFMSAILFFLAGADLVQLGIAAVVAAIIGVSVLGTLGYAQERVESYVAGAQDLTQANYHVQQAVIAFINGGWTGVGLGEGRQKFGFLPAPHTDSIFAVIGEELGIVGAGIVVALYLVLVIRGLSIARRALDPFGMLMAAGITIWIAAKALLNIAVMTAVLPATGAPLPLISFGGSSLVVMMAGVGLLVSIGRVSALHSTPERREGIAYTDRSRGDRRTRLPGDSSRRSDSDAAPGG